MKIITSLGYKKFLGAAAILSLASLPLPAQALPSQEINTVYYKDASKTEVVGEFTLLCNGQRYSNGQRTNFKTTFKSPCSSGGGGSGKLPCEFTSQTPEQQGKCNYLPNPRIYESR